MEEEATRGKASSLRANINIIYNYIYKIYSAFFFKSLRMHEVEEEGSPIVDVDGSYVYKKYKSLTEAGVSVTLPSAPPPPIMMVSRQ